MGEMKLRYILLLFLLSTSSVAAEMNSPNDFERRSVPLNKKEILITSAPLYAMKSLIVFFQRYISPVDGGRCVFYPTCSQYGKEALLQKGPLRGVLMTGDRLIRCHPWAYDEFDYSNIHYFKIFDPVTFD